MLNQSNQEEKTAMIAMTYQEWAGTNDPEKDEFYRAIIHLIKMGMISAHYDDKAGCMAFTKISGG